MKKVTPKSAGVKLNGKWCFKNQEAIISEEEYEVKKAFVNVLEDVKESNKKIEKVESAKAGKSQNPEGE